MARRETDATPQGDGARQHEIGTGERRTDPVTSVAVTRARRRSAPELTGPGPRTPPFTACASFGEASAIYNVS